MIAAELTYVPFSKGGSQSWAVGLELIASCGRNWLAAAECRRNASSKFAVVTSKGGGMIGLTAGCSFSLRLLAQMSSGA